MYPCSITSKTKGEALRSFSQKGKRGFNLPRTPTGGKTEDDSACCLDLVELSGTLRCCDGGLGGEWSSDGPESGAVGTKVPGEATLETDSAVWTICGVGLKAAKSRHGRSSPKKTLWKACLPEGRWAWSGFLGCFLLGCGSFLGLKVRAYKNSTNNHPKTIALTL